MSSPADDFPEDETSARLRALYRQLPADEPSAATDDAILAAARRATKSGPAAVPWTRRWRVPLAAAATLLLAFGILLQMPTQRTVVQDAFDEPRALDEKSSVNAGSTVAAAPAEIAADAGPLAESVPQQRAPESLAKEKREFAAVPSPAPAKKSVTAAKAAAEPAAELADADDAEATGSGAGSASGAIAAAAETRAEMETDTADALAGAQQQQAAPARERIVAEAKAEAEMAAAASTKALRNAPAAPVAAAAPPAPVAPSALMPRGAPWPFGLVPTLAPDTACARLIQESGGDCRARIVSGGLELRLTGGDSQWLYRLRDSLAELGWQEASGVPAGSGRYSRRTTAGIERFEWSPQSGALVLKLLAAD